MINTLKSIKTRKNAVCQLAATKALELPYKSSGFWFHDDVRNNFYYAIHLFAYSVDDKFESDWNDEKRGKAKKIASDMISKVLSLQMIHEDHSMYGHWPLELGNDPYTAQLNVQPVELMGCLLILFYHKYQQQLPEKLSIECKETIEHIYKSNVFRQPVKEMYHHEAKHTSQKLLFGYLFNDGELKKDGVESARFLLNHIQKYGFKEYGILPWHWGWVQSFTCVREIVEDTDVLDVVDDLLNYLWELRVDYYLKGTWVGAHSRQWPHDTPRDNNTLHDYIQFGDFPMPSEITRLEGACFFSYQVGEEIVTRAINPRDSFEVKRKIQFAKADGIVTNEVHTYLLKTPDYAIGGVWERLREFDNEQRRWDITLPLTQTNASKSVNQAFFFHPGEKYISGDDRHESNYGEVLFHKGCVIQIWAIPEGEKSTYPNIIGCLPLGEWKFEDLSGYGKVESTYITIKLMNKFEVIERQDRISINSPNVEGWNGVTVEVISHKDAKNLGIDNLESFIASTEQKNNNSRFKIDQLDKVSTTFTTWENDELQFTIDKLSNCERHINNKTLSLNEYKIY